MNAEEIIVAEVEGYEDLSRPGAPSLPIIIVLPNLDHQFGRSEARRVKSAPQDLRPGQILMCLEERRATLETNILAWWEARPGNVWKIERKLSVAEENKIARDRRGFYSWAESYMRQAVEVLQYHPGVISV